MPLSEYRMRRRVQFYETDAAGLVHFSWFYRYMEEAEHAMWREAGLSIHQPESGLGWPRVAASFEFFKPLRFEDEFVVQVRIAEITSRTIRYICEVTKNGARIAAGTMTIVCVRRDGRTMEAAEIPESIARHFTHA